MNYTKEEVLQFVAEEDVKFIRLAFCDVFGKQKNISVMPHVLPKAFRSGISIDASAIESFGSDVHRDLLLHPDPDTFSILPWRPEHGRVVRMLSTLAYPDGTPFENDTRGLLKQAIQDAREAGLTFAFGSNVKFYLFKQNENGERTDIPYDNAGYMDIAPDDKGENVRREICLTLERMGIMPTASHHEKGPGQNSIEFLYSDALSAADNTTTFFTVVKTIAANYGLYADFSPKPLAQQPGSGFHVVLSANSEDGSDPAPYIAAGILNRIAEITAFLNPTDNSYDRLKSHRTRKYITWSKDNYSQLVRIREYENRNATVSLNSPDSLSNPYIVFALLIYAALEGIKNKEELPAPCGTDLRFAEHQITDAYPVLPSSKEEALKLAQHSTFLKEHLPERMIESYCFYKS